MNVTKISEEDDPLDYNSQALTTFDWQLTNNAHNRFANACQRKLVKAQLAGRGYFVTASPEELQNCLEVAISDSDWESVANYAMMLRTKEILDKEREDWLANQDGMKSFLER